MVIFYKNGVILVGRFTNEETKKIISNIETLIAENCESKMQFYEESGITSSQYSQWNTGLKNPSLSSLKNIAKYFDVPVEYLVIGDASKTRRPPDNDTHETNYPQREEMRQEMRILFDAAEGVPASAILEAAALLMRYKEKNQ